MPRISGACPTDADFIDTTLVKTVEREVEASGPERTDAGFARLFLFLFNLLLRVVLFSRSSVRTFRHGLSHSNLLLLPRVAGARIFVGLWFC